MFFSVAYSENVHADVLVTCFDFFIESWLVYFNLRMVINSFFFNAALEFSLPLVSICQFKWLIHKPISFMYDHIKSCGSILEIKLMNSISKDKRKYMASYLWYYSSFQISSDILESGSWACILGVCMIPFTCLSQNSLHQCFLE